MNKFGVLMVCVVMVSLLWASIGQAQDQDRPPNVVLILADDMGVFDLGCYSRKDHRTPNLDRLASQGIRHTSAYCGLPICSASRASLLTSKYPARLHLTTYLPGRADAASQRLLQPEIEPALVPSAETLAEALKRFSEGWQLLVHDLRQQLLARLALYILPQGSPDDFVLRHPAALSLGSECLLLLRGKSHGEGHVGTVSLMTPHVHHPARRGSSSRASSPAEGSAGSTG